MKAADRGLLPAVALLSGAALGFEIVLLRFFSIRHGHHFAHLVISMALLGVGLSGTVLTFVQERWRRSFPVAFFACALGASLAFPLAVTFAGRTGFNPPEVIWDVRQLGRLAQVFLALSVPFLFTGLCIGLAMRTRARDAPRIYRADLAGAAAGAFGVTLLLFAARPSGAVRALGILAAAAAALVTAAEPAGPSRARRRTLAALVLLLHGVWPAALLTPQVSSFKALSHTRLLPDTRVVAEAWSPTGWFLAVASDRIPLRYAPGLSLASPREPPPQVALFHDGHAAGVLHAGTEDDAAFAYLQWTPMALPYALAPRSRVLVLGAGGGGDVGHARLEGATDIVAVEAQRAWFQFAEGPLRPFGGPVFERPGVRRRAGDPRGWLARDETAFDLIQISPMGTALPPEPGGAALATDYLYTVEGLRAAFARLAPGGALSISLPLEMPPRAWPRLLATLRAAMEREGIGDPGAHAAAVRAWNVVTVAVSREPLSSEQRRAARGFARSRAFDLVWLPDLAPDEVNRVNILEHPFFHEAAAAIFSDARADYQRRHPFLATPATDDRPFFGHTFRWRSFRAFWAQRGAGSAGMIEWEYLLLWMSLGVAGIASALLIALPIVLMTRRRRAEGGAPGGLAAPAIYFAALGLAFLFIEIAFIQKFVLFLGDPVYAMAVVVPSFLLFAGLGSGWAGRRLTSVAGAERGIRKRPVAFAVGMLAVTAALYATGWPLFFRLARAWPDAVRIVVGVALIGGLGFWMGMPFPLALARLGRRRPELIPLAWGVNGFFSVLSAIAATILALHFGFRLLLAAAVALYVLAAALERRV